MLIVAATLVFVLGLGAGYMAGLGRRRDILSARRVAKIVDLDRGEIARLRREGVL